MSDQETTTRDDNEIIASLRATRYARSVLEPEHSPEQVQKRYLAKAGQYYFRDRNNALAFADKGSRLATQTEDPVVVASMIDVAIAKGWKDLKVTGSESFRRAIWLEAAKRGMSVRGYEPRPQDELHLKEVQHQQSGTVPANQIGPERARAFTTMMREEAIQRYPELQKAYAARDTMNQWIDLNIPRPDKRMAIRAAVAQGMAERLARGEMPGVAVMPEPTTRDQQQVSAIHKQAFVMGAVARAKGMPEQKVRIVIAAAERIGKHLADQKVWIPEPMVYDRQAPARTRGQSNQQHDESGKPEIRRQPRIQPRR